MPIQVRETEDSLRQERELMTETALFWRKDFIKLHKFSSVDYGLVGNEKKILAFVEVKCRRQTMDELDGMGGVMLSAAKWSQAKVLCDGTGVPFIFIVRMASVAWYHRTKDFVHDGLTIGGRTDRDDPRDQEPVILLRAARFSLVVAR